MFLLECCRETFNCQLNVLVMSDTSRTLRPAFHGPSSTSESTEPSALRLLASLSSHSRFRSISTQGTIESYPRSHQETSYSTSYSPYEIDLSRSDQRALDAEGVLACRAACCGSVIVRVLTCSNGCRNAILQRLRVLQ